MAALEARLEGYSEEDLRPLKEIRYVNYGYCVGFLDDNGKAITKSHKFYDGKSHVENSGELCEACYEVYETYRQIGSEELLR